MNSKEEHDKAVKDFLEHPPKKSDIKQLKKIAKKWRKKDEDKKAYLIRSFYELRSILGYWWAIFYILLGGRDSGKSYAASQFAVDQFINKGRPFYWLRLTPTSKESLLENNAAKLVENEIRQQYHLDLFRKGDEVYNVLKRDKDGHPRKMKLMCTVLALSDFYNDKGVSHYDFKFLNDPDMYYLLILDEMNREKNERKTFDICYALINQIENLVRETNYRIRVIMIGNTLDSASDIMCMFNFIPEEFGRYKLVKNKKKLVEYLLKMNKSKTGAEREKIKKEYEQYDFGKRAVVEYMPLTDKYKTRRHGSIADILMPKASTFSNKVKVDDSLVSKERLVRPSAIIKFSKEQEDWYTIWNDNLIVKYNNEQVETVFAMRKYIDDVFIPDRQKTIIDLFDTRNFKFRNLITFKTFQKNLEVIKPQK